MSEAVSERSRPEPALWQRLKTATADHHRRIEERFGILDPGLTRADYRFWLERLYGFYAPLESALEPWAGPMAIDWQARRKTAWLRADLAHLGHDPDAIAGLPVCTALPAVGDLAAAFGVAYVLEGATLGGRIIARRLRGRLGVDAAGGAAFFTAYGDDVDVRWAAFRQRLAAAVAPLDAERRTIAAACETFDTLGAWLAAGRVSTRHGQVPAP